MWVVLWRLAHQGGTQRLETRGIEGLGQQIGHVLLGGDELDVDRLGLAQFTKIKMTTLDVARVAAVGAVVQDALRARVVNEEGGRTVAAHLDVGEQVE